MRRISRMVRKQGTAPITNTDGLTVVTTEWMLAHGAETLRVLQDLRQLDGSWRSKAGYRFAQVRTDEPEAWVDSATVRSGADAYTEDFDISGTTDAMWIQARVTGYAASGIAEALVKLQAGLDETAYIVAARTLQLNPLPNSGEIAYHPISSPFPAQDLTGIMGALHLTSVSGTIGYGTAIRFFEDPSKPQGTWTDLSTFPNVTADELKNTGDDPVTPGTNLWAQVAIRQSGTSGRATLKAILSAKYGS